MTEPVMCVDIVIQSNKIEWKEKSGRGEKKKKAEVSEWESEQETFQFASTGFFSDRRCENRHRRGYTRSEQCVVDRCDDTHT
jgi:hypothetical protein